MSLLDDLKQQAESLALRERAVQDNRSAKLQAAHSRLSAALQYWVEFFKTLNVVKPPVLRNYYLEGSNQLAGLVQCDYNVNGRRLTVDHRDYIDAIVLRFRCAAPGKIIIEKESQALVTRLQEHLWRHGLKFDLKETRGNGAYVERGTFSIQNEVVVTMTIAAEMDDAQIKLTVRNLPRLGEDTYVYDNDEFGPELFEEIGKAVLGQANQLRTLGRRQAQDFSSLAGAGAPSR
jgi:hypothetical protein